MPERSRLYPSYRKIGTKNFITRRSLLKTLTPLALGSLSIYGSEILPADFPVRFEDIARRAGLTTPTVYGGASANRYILETTGCGAAFIDYDNDGWLDLFLVNGATLDGAAHPSNRLLKNNRNGTFTDVTREAGLERSGWGQGVCVGDFDNDGHDDLFITYWGQNVLYRNNYDGDGWLDLFVSNYIDFDPKKAPLPGSGSCVYQGIPVNCGPQGLPHAKNFLFRNNRNG